jgi:hypothetical protein
LKQPVNRASSLLEAAISLLSGLNSNNGNIFPYPRVCCFRSIARTHLLSKNTLNAKRASLAAAIYIFRSATDGLVLSITTSALPGMVQKAFFLLVFTKSIDMLNGLQKPFGVKSRFATA